ncbi:c-type cytochrome biogenesis protein CcsB [Prochlorococcus sp. MIT 1223]|uniref:c-type cytochrome biogenesis protein CcsB n=1 Tax=Prochlorococcus sp. MIT 1223 TaxID=3096217 RepID=UPI0039C18867
MNLIDINSYIGDPVLLFGFLAFLFLLISLPFSFWAAGGSQVSVVVKLMVAIANLFLATQLILRWWQSGHFPISNLYESLCFLTWACTIVQLLVERSWNSPFIAAFSIPISLLTISFASFALPDQLRLAAPLVPALRSSWLVMHVSVIMCSYAALIVGSLLSFAVLFIDRSGDLQIRSSSIGVGGFRASSSDDSGDISYTSIQPVIFNQIEQLDSLSYRTITVGFLLLTVGLISGAVWANEAWGSWWSWDPKETWALICWLVYAAYLHVRLVKGWQGKKPALIAISGLIVISICYIGVNLLGIGLHSYGWFFDT